MKTWYVAGLMLKKTNVPSKMTYQNYFCECTILLACYQYPALKLDIGQLTNINNSWSL